MPFLIWPGQDRVKDKDGRRTRSQSIVTAFLYYIILCNNQNTTRAEIGQINVIYCSGKSQLESAYYFGYFIKAVKLTFLWLWVYRHNKPNGTLGEHEKSCKSRAEGEKYVLLFN